MSGLAPIVVASSDSTSSVLAYRNVIATQQGGGGVTRIVGGTNITVTPPEGIGVVTIAATGSAGGGVTSIASANANLTVSPVGGTGAVTLTVPTQAVPNPILDASLGINTTGTGTTTIGSTAAGAIGLVSPTVNINRSGTGLTQIGNASNVTDIIGTNLTFNSTGTGITQIGNTGTGGPVQIYAQNSMLVQTPTSVLEMVGSTANLYAPTLNINSGGSLSGNTNIGNTTGTTTFTGTVVGLPAATVPNPINNASLGLNSTGTGTTTIGSTAAGTVAIVSPTINVNSSGTGNTNIGNATGTTTFTGTVLGLPTLPYAAYYVPSSTTALTVSAFNIIPFTATIDSPGAFFLNTPTNAFRIAQNGIMQITLTLSLLNSSGSQNQPLDVIMYNNNTASVVPGTRKRYLAVNHSGATPEPSTYTYITTFAYTSGTYLTAQIFPDAAMDLKGNTGYYAAEILVQFLR